MVLCLFVCGLLNAIFSSLDYVASIGGLISKWWAGRDVKGSDRGLIRGIIPPFAWMDLEKTQRTSGRWVGVPPETGAERLLNTIRKRYGPSQRALYSKAIILGLWVCSK
jgi:hypothetical protein